MEIHQGERLKGRKYLGVAMSALLVMGFVMMQPIPVFGNGDVPGDCKTGVDPDVFPTDCIINLEDGIAMNTVRSGKFVLTVHAEKEVFKFENNPSDPTDNRITDYTAMALIFENLNRLPEDPVISTQLHGFSCDKKENTAQLLGCSAGGPSIDRRTVIDTDECVEPPALVPHFDSVLLPLTHPQEMNTITKGNIAKTIEAQKEVFVCEVDEATGGNPLASVFVGSRIKEVVMFTEVYEDLATHSIIGEPRFIALTCVKFALSTGGSCVFDNILN